MHTLLATALAFLVVAPVSAQSLVRNLVTTTSGQFTGNVQRFVPLGNQALFVANSPFGLELWATDGSPLATRLLVDLMPGGNSSPSDLVVFGTRVLFAANVPGYGRELWQTDGTTVGTTLLADIWPGETGSSPSGLVVFGGHVWFAANDGTNGSELWRTDGTPVGTTRFADLSAANGGSSPARLTVAGGSLFFTANDGATGIELWRTDGTLANTQRVADLTAGAASTSFDSLAPFGSRLLFAANVGGGLEPFVSDGTLAGTFQLAELQPGTTPSSPAGFTPVGGWAVFSADGPGVGRELYRTDGTPAGTTLLADLHATGSSDPAALTVHGGAVVFAATTSANGREPWRTDGTAAGTFQLADLLSGSGSSNPTGFAPVGSELWFAAFGAGIGSELHRTDGTIAGTMLVADLVPGNASTAPSAITAFGAGVLMSAATGGAGNEPHFTDGTPGNTVLLDDCYPPVTNSYPAQWAELGTEVFFAAGSDGQGNEPYRSDGTFAGTTMIADVLPGSFGANPTFPAGIGTQVFFTGDLFTAGSQLFVTDGTTTTQLTSASPAVHPRGTVAFGSGVVFSGVSGNGRELWVSDGTVAGTFELFDIRPGSADGFPLLGENFTVLGNQVFFTANDGLFGNELWVSDGTVAGTRMVVDLNAGTFSSSPTSLVTLGGWLYFLGAGTGVGTEVWRTDGTAANTTVVADLVPGPASSFPQNLVVAGNRLFFTAAVAGQREVYTSDGTPGNWLAVTTTASGRLNAYADLRGTQVGAFFLHDDLTGFGRELWCSDGTVAGTRRVLDIAPGQRSGPVPSTLTAVFGGTQVLFGASEHDHGLQLWLSDGTAVGTQKVSGFGTPGQGVGVATMQSFFATGPRVFFACDDGINGFEPWLFDALGGAVPFVLPYGPGCNGSAGVPSIGANGLAHLGNASFAITVTQAMPNSIAVLAASLGSTNIPFDGCRVLVDLPITIWANPLTDAAGFATAPLTIPNDPTMLGDNLFFQYAVVDPIGTVLGFLALSNGLQVQIGV